MVETLKGLSRARRVGRLKRVGIALGPRPFRSNSPAWRICVFGQGDPFFGESLSLRQKPRTATTLTISSGSFISSRTIFLSSFA
jgi:hypothetical protein